MLSTGPAATRISSQSRAKKACNYFSISIATRLYEALQGVSLSKDTQIEEFQPSMMRSLPEAKAEAAVVQAFNNLPRPEKTPSGIPNHWYFTVRHVDLQPPGDLVHLVNPDSHYIHCAGPTQILSLPSAAAKAEVIVPLLLDSFIQGLTTDPNGNPIREMSAFAPWTWATKDSELAKAIEKNLKEIGVRKELCIVELGSKEQQDISDTSWAGFFDTLKNQALNINDDSENSTSSVSNSTTACAKCKKDRSSLPNPLKKCSRCGGPRYCSQECQKADWKQHKKVCRPTKPSQQASTSTSRSNKADAFQYYNKVAYKVPEAQSLARSLNLTLPTEQDNPEGIM